MRFYRAVIYIRFFDGRSGSLALEAFELGCDLSRYTQIRHPIEYKPCDRAQRLDRQAKRDRRVFGGKFPQHFGKAV